MKTSKEGIALIKRHEGLKLTVYRCPANVLTIGYGHTGADVTEGLTITEAEADRLLKQDLKGFEKTVNAQTNGLTQNQFDALVSLCYNIGEKAFKNSTLLKCVKANPQNVNIRREFMRWVHVGGKRMDGLLRRRREESELYFKA